MIQASCRIGGRQACRKRCRLIFGFGFWRRFRPAPRTREAADRLGVSAASVSRWRTRERNRGDACPKALGGDRRSGRIEAHHEAVMAALGPDRDATIQEVRRDLAARGLTFEFGTIQRFFARHAITRKKRPRTPRSRIVQTSQSDD